MAELLLKSLGMSAVRNQAPLMDLADLDLGDLLPPEMQKRTASGVFTRPVVAPRQTFRPGPVGTRLPSQPPAPRKNASSPLLNLLFASGGFLLATTVATYFLCR